MPLEPGPAPRYGAFDTSHLGTSDIDDAVADSDVVPDSDAAPDVVPDSDPVPDAEPDVDPDSGSDLGPDVPVDLCDGVVCTAEPCFTAGTSPQPLTCDFNTLPPTRGQHYFDVSDLCLPVTAGEVLRFEVDLLAVGETACVGGQCVPGPVGLSCISDHGCAYVDGIASGANGYPGGTLIDPSGIPYPDGDMHFRSYVDPLVPASP